MQVALCVAALLVHVRRSPAAADALVRCVLRLRFQLGLELDLHDHRPWLRAAGADEL
eukprot:COSAG01_NODE_1112_length_11654_cov_8.254435_5_plen_57_part_00